ncbi:MAG: H-type lectin domain-containing protein [Phaeobacter italicus]|jgi:hypothetical protein|uniref:H-type lectin domain-containing protein n=1 Tax=Phaeobacter italicus TaxID=481446 RepID=UPI001AD982AE|nr:H-type lectin domain-containing protein [Phaeobacter italicus]MBO9441760.1 H-type lectin domain-containing protein [Phaeobacter italicus]MCI5099694.1 H-type lectin domain-containing protein [Phaeobacter italicus]
MQRIDSPRIGVDQGDIEIFSEFEEGGAMWAGDGPRERRRHVRFGESFSAPPVVHISTSLVDMAAGTAFRSELVAEDITVDGFDMVFRTWNDTRVARIRAAWMAIGNLPFGDDWDVS